MPNRPMPSDPVDRMIRMQNEELERLRAVERFGSRPKGLGEQRRGSGKDWATVVVAAINSHLLGRASADFTCSGEEDETTLDQAVASLPETGGRIVLLEGTYHLSDTWVVQSFEFDPWSVHIQGMGLATVLLSSGSGAVIEMTTDSPTVSHLWIGDGDDGVVLNGSEAYIYGVRVRPYSEARSITGGGISLVGSRGVAHSCWVSDVGGIGIEASGSEVKITTCDVENTGGNGIYATGGETFVEDCRTENTDGRGIYLTGSRVSISNCVILTTGTEALGVPGIHTTGADVNISGCHVELAGSVGIYSTGGETRVIGNRVVDPANYAIRLDSGPCLIHGNILTGCPFGGIRTTASQITITDNHLQGLQEDWGIYTNSSECTISGNDIYVFEQGIRACEGAVIVGNKVRNPTKDGIVVEQGDDGIIQGNSISDGGGETTDTYSGILVNGDYNRWNIQGNTVRSNDFKYGINIGSVNADDTLCTNNDLLNSAVTASFNDAGTGTITAAGNRL